MTDIFRDIFEESFSLLLIVVLCCVLIASKNIDPILLCTLLVGTELNNINPKRMKKTIPVESRRVEKQQTETEEERKQIFQRMCELWPLEAWPTY